MQDLSFSFYDKNRTGQLMSRVTGDLFEITELAHYGPGGPVHLRRHPDGRLLVMLTIRWELALVVFAVVPLFSSSSPCAPRKRMMHASAEVKRRDGRHHRGTEGTISGHAHRQAFCQRGRRDRQFERSIPSSGGPSGGYYRAMAVYHSGDGLAMGLMPVLVIASAATSYACGGGMDYRLSPPFTLYVTTFVTPIRKLSAFVEQFMQGHGLQTVRGAHAGGA